MKTFKQLVQEISTSTVKSYSDKAKKEISQTKPFTKKGEYKDLAKNIVARRTAGLKKAKSRLQERCWTGYKPVPGKKPYSKGSCKKEGYDYDIEVFKLKEDIDFDFDYSHIAIFEQEDGQLIDLYLEATDDKDALEKALMHESVLGVLVDIEEGSEYLDEKSPAWQRKEGKSKSGGLNKKGIASYRREHPGSKLSMAVTTKPSKLKKGSKAAKRRKSFCSRMSGMKRRLTSSATAKDPNSRINKALRKWNC